MKIRKLTKIALAFVLSSTLLFEGCKKYDDDLSRLEGQISSLKTDLDQLAKGSTIEKVNVIPDGLELILVDYQGNKKTQKVTNGKDGVDGKPGTIWQINSTSKEWEYSKDGGWVSTGIIAQGKDGLPGQDGNDGAPGKDGNDGAPGKDGNDGAPGKDGNDGAPGKDGNDGAPGKDGNDGAPGLTPEIKEDLASGKFYWWIGTTNTGTLAYPGEVYAVDDGAGVTVTIWSADGSSPIDVYFSRTQNSITSITLIPDMVTADAGTPVINFPRIIMGGDISNTAMSGITYVSYKLNPFGVLPSKYDVEGFVSQYNREAPKLRSGSGDALENFDIVVDPATSFGELRIKVTPQTGSNSPFAKLAASGKDRMNIALRVNNTWAGQQAGDPNLYKVTSGYNVAMEEIINNSELSIEKIDENSVAPEYKLFAGVTTNYQASPAPSPYQMFADNNANSQNTLVNFDNTAAYNSSSKLHLRDKAIQFTLSYREDATANASGLASYRGGIDLSQKLKGFFIRQYTSVSDRLISMDENGFTGYTLKFSIPGVYNPTNATNTAADPTDHNSYITIDPDGLVQVNLTGGGGYNINAVGKTPIVKVDMVTDDAAATVMATRYIKLAISQAVAPATVGAVLATATAPAHLLVGGGGAPTPAVPLTYVVNNSLDDVLATLNYTAAQFYNTYEINTATPQTITGGPAGGPTGNLRLITNAANKETRLRVNGVNVRPGTYTITTKYTPITPNPAEPPIDLTVTVTLDESRIATLSPTATNWSNGKGKINGYDTGAGWEMTSTLIDLWQIKPVTVPGTPITSYKFEIVNPVPGITLSNPGLIELSTNPITQAITLDETNPTAKTYINDPSKTVKIKLTTYVTIGNITHSEEEFDVYFVNPVKAIVAKTPILTMLDKDANPGGENLGTAGIPEVDLRRAFEIKDEFGATIFDYKLNSAFAFDNGTSKYQDPLVTLFGINNLSQGGAGTQEGLLATAAITFVKAEYLDGTEMILSGSQSGLPNGSNAKWVNNGIGLTAPINLVYKITLTNKFNDGTVPATEDQVIKEIRVKVNPQP